MNTRRNTLALVVGFSLIGATLLADVQNTPVLQQEAQSWIRYSIPLPKQIDISGKVRLPANQVVVRAVDDDDSLLIQQAVKELHETLGGGATRAAGSEDLFAITLQLGNRKADILKKYKYADQAYMIQPAEAGKGLVCTAIGPRGLYYASKTLQQLMKAKLADGQVEIPLAKVIDWPDMDDRGLWGGDASDHIRWLSDRKMNYLEHISHTSVDKDKRCHVSYPPFKQKMIDEGPTYGIEPVPVILHLEQLKGSGLFDAYPDLQGKEATPGVICYSNPEFVDVLAEWLVLWGQTPGVSEVDVWMAENMYGKKSCQCNECKKEDRAILEAQMIVKAWGKAKLRLPELGLRILTSEASEASNARFIPLLPPDVKLWYYHSLFTYNTSHTPMIGHYQPYLIDAVKAGRWVGVCLNITAVVGLWQPMSSAVFVHSRMNEFVDKKIAGILGYSTPGIPYCRLNTEAAAEWTWNAKGRSTREFALSYAVRQGYKDPEKFADWLAIMGAVSWDVYGSAMPLGELHNQPGKLADLVREGKLPELGSVLWDLYAMPFGDIKTVDQLNHDVEQAAKGVNLAREMGISEYIHESIVVQGYINAIKALWELKQVVKPEGVSDKATSAKWFQAYVDALRQVRDHLPLWENTLPGRESEVKMVGKAVKLLQGMIDGMKSTATHFGIQVE